MSMLLLKLSSDAHLSENVGHLALLISPGEIIIPFTYKVMKN